jgi:hypothetical protein
MHHIVNRMLAENDKSPCIEMIDYRTEFGIKGSGVVDPISGQPIDENWIAALPQRDVQWCADFLVSEYYSANEEFGVGPTWHLVHDQISGPARNSLVGQTIGPLHRHFDPTGLGSSFFCVEEVCRVLQVLVPPLPDAMACYVDLFERCGAQSMGVYVRFTED